MELTIRFAFALLAIAGPLAAQAMTREECTRIDLREERCSNGHRRIPEPRNQGSTNYCFAYTLADVYSFKTCQTYSGLHAGLAANLRAWDMGRPPKGGYDG